MSKRIVFVLALVSLSAGTPAFALFVDFEYSVGNNGDLTSAKESISLPESDGLNWPNAASITDNDNVEHRYSGDTWYPVWHKIYGENYGGSRGAAGQDEPVPEPASWCLLGLGLAGLMLRRNRRNW